MSKFWAQVGGVWAALKAKQQWDEPDYRAISTAEDGVENGEIRLPNSAQPVDESGESLLGRDSTEVKRNAKKRGCCICCGVDYSLFWKAFGVVAGLWLVYGIFSGFKWAVTPSSTGLAKMSSFGSALGCDDSVFFYKGASTGFPFTVPVSEKFHDHTIKLQGGAVGTLIITNAPVDTKDVSYNIVLRGSDKATVDAASFEIEEPDSGLGTALRFNTANIARGDAAMGACMRFDIVMSVPSSVKILNIHSRSILQVKFADDARFDLKELSIVLFKLDDQNMIISSANVSSDDINYEVYRGWITGDITVSDVTSVVTQRSNGVVHLKVHPTAPQDPLHPKIAYFRTTTGSGKTDITYIANPMKRPIDSRHYSSQNGDVYLNYKEARFDGKILMKSKTSTIIGALPISFSDRMSGDDKALKRLTDADYTHVHGSKEGIDRMEISSRGWTGLYF